MDKGQQTAVTMRQGGGRVDTQLLVVNTPEHGGKERESREIHSLSLAKTLHLLFAFPLGNAPSGP